jgi:hypothetical protein
MLTQFSSMKMREINARDAQLAFDKSNPFDDPKAHNYLIMFQYHFQNGPLDTQAQASAAKRCSENEAVIVERVLQKVVAASGKTVSYPVTPKKGTWEYTMNVWA